MLALDGGGIRGLITLGILERIEGIVREREGQPLHEYFDYIAGTSTGAIIAAGLARGLPVRGLIEFYTSCGEQMFEPSRLVQRLKHLYTADPLKAKLQDVFGAHTDLGPDSLKCLLLVVAKNVTTDSPWPISSNPDALFNDPSRPDCNLRIPLWQLVRASTAAPVYFPPEILQIDPSNLNETFVFVDGGVTPYNNPAFLLYRMATEPAYRLDWRTGEDRLLLVSVGTGTSERRGGATAAADRNIFSNVTGLPGDLMHGIQVDQDISCRIVGRCAYGGFLDRELLDLVPREAGDPSRDGLSSAAIPLSTNLGRQFLYARYNVDLSDTGLRELGFTDLVPERIQRMDAVENAADLLRVGRAAAGRVSAAHFGPFLRAARD
jgi:hypothetical protein